MPKFILRLLLTLDATLWMFVIYGIKEHWVIWGLSSIITSILLILLPILLSLCSLAFSLTYENDSISSCRECALADNEFLPIYLGYFFVALSVGDTITLVFVYAIVFVFTYLNHTLYFNPIFLLFGYHFYYAHTEQGTKVFLITRGKVIRNSKGISFPALKRISNMTYLVIGGYHE